MHSRPKSGPSTRAPCPMSPFQASSQNFDYRPFAYITLGTLCHSQHAQAYTAHASLKALLARKFKPSGNLTEIDPDVFKDPFG
eukprot:1141857-Pelagomonas_calceolata.AAC.3